MSHKDINAALSKHAQALPYPIAFENGSSPDKSGIYIEEGYIPATTNIPSIDRRGIRDYRGIYQLVVYAPRDKTKGDAFSAADAISKHFRPITRLVRNGVTVEINNEPQQAGGFVVGDRFAIPVSIDFRALVRFSDN